MNMKKLFTSIKISMMTVALLAIASCYTISNLYNVEASISNTFIAGASSNTDIVINEFVPNPLGSDNAAMPGGEWVELYNKGDWAIDLNGWRLYDSIDSHELEILALNIVGGDTVIPAKGYLVVYRNTDSDFALNNSGGDSVRLYDDIMSSGTLIDSIGYLNSTEDKSWSRMPNGIGSFSDGHITTPNGPNV